MGELTVKIKPLTPLWTGDIDSRSDSISPTGIIGSLRWWTEAILRCMDKYACDPTNDEKNVGKCPQEHNRRKYYCTACLIFGATGLRRTFRLDISGGENTFSGGLINIKPSGRNRGWYLGNGVIGEIDLKITPLDKDFDQTLVLLPLVIASNWGGIGAKTQHGYGVVKVENIPKINIEQFESAIEKLTKEGRLSKFDINLRQQTNDVLPNLNEMFFAKIQFETRDEWWKGIDGIAPREQDNYRGYVNDPRMKKWVESGSVPISPAIKNWLRFRDGRKLWETGDQKQDTKIENWVFGTINRVCTICYGGVKRDKKNPQNFWCPNCSKSLRKENIFERIASKINISCAYKVSDDLWEFRIWGWIPKGELPAGFDRDSFLNNLKQALSGRSITIPWDDLLGDQTRNHKLKVWREYNSPRDTVNPNESNIDDYDYIQSLLKGEVG